MSEAIATETRALRRLIERREWHHQWWGQKTWVIPRLVSQAFGENNERQANRHHQ